MKKIILILLTGIIGVGYGSAQQKEIILNENKTGTTETYKARDAVYLKEGFKYTAAPQTSIHIKTDPHLVCPTDYLSNAPTSESHQLNTTYRVGTTQGGWDVSPTGAVMYSMPVFVSPGTANVQPNLSINYNSMGGNGMMGMGWNLSGYSAITRTSQTPYLDGLTKNIQFTTQDKLALDGNRLIHTIGSAYGTPGAQYETENETFTKIKSYDAGNGQLWFTVWNNAGWELEYGATPDSRICADGSSVPYMWCLNKSSDPYGNYITYEYATEKGESRLIRISYTGNTEAGIAPFNSVEFFYGQRADTGISYIGGYPIHNKILLEEIRITCEEKLVKRYTFEYTQDIFTYGSNDRKNTHHLTSLLSVINEYAADGSQFNPIIIDWGENNTPVFSKEELKGGIVMDNADVLIGDFNGDGKSDILTLNKTDHKTHYYLSSPAHDSFQDHPFNMPFQKAQVADLDNDGIDDVIFHNEKVLWENYNYDYDFQFRFSRPQNNDFTITDYGESPGKVSGNGTFLIPKVDYLVGDFDGDGSNEIIQIKKIITKNIANQDICIIEWNAFSYFCKADGSLTKILKGNGIIKDVQWYQKDGYAAVDVNGDGRLELLVFHETYTAIYQLEKGVMKQTFKGEGIYADPYFADINGDGYTDMITYKGHLQKVISPTEPYWASEEWIVEWFVYYSDGNGYPSKTYLDLYPKLPGDPLLLVDINGDGKAEAIIPYDDKKHIFWNTNNEYVRSYHENISELNNSDERIYPGDFNGDGKIDFLVMDKTSKKANVCLMYKGKKKHLVHAVTDGMNQTSRFEYKALTDSTVYTKGKGSLFPIMDFQSPLYVASRVQFPNDSGGTSHFTYTYAGARVHKQGNGFMGFTEVTQTYPDANRIFKSTFEYYRTYFTPFLNKSEVFEYNTQKRLSVDSCVNQIRSLGSKKFFPYVSERISIDEISYKKTQSFYNYDTVYNLLFEVINISFPDKNKATYQYKEVQYFMDYKLRYRNLVSPGYTKTSYWKDGKWEHTDPVYYAYNHKGKLASTTQYKDDPNLELITGIEYNIAGLPYKTTVRNRQSGTREDILEFEPRYRWKTKSTSTGDFVNQYTYEPTFGNLISETAHNGLTTRYEYDTWGGITQTFSPDGNWVKQVTEWFSSTYPFVNKAAYRNKTTASNAQTSTSYYTASGKEVMTEQESDFNIRLYVFTSYDKLGRVKEITQPQAGMDLTNGSYRYTTYEYEPYYGNLISERDLAKGAGNASESKLVHHSYTYDYRNRITTVKDHIKDFVIVKKYDINGNIISSDEPSGTLHYYYTPSGRLNRMDSPGTSRVFTLDKAGNRTSVSEGNAGTTHNTYNGFGELTSHTNAKGIPSFYQYTPDGRILSKITFITYYEPEVYTYYYSNTGVTKGLLDSIDHTHSSTAFAYDAYGREKSITRHIDEKSFTTEYQYNAQNKLEQMTYPGIGNNRLNLRYTYDGEKGRLKEITETQYKESIWKINAVNDRGLKTQVLYNNNQYKTDFSYEPETYRIARVKTGSFFTSVSDWEYTYERGLMKTRRDHITNQQETFTYDHAFRLEKIDQTRGSLSFPEVAKFTYDPMGNMTHKSDIGQMEYGADSKPHALKQVEVNDIPDPLQKEFSSLSCQATYTYFNKMERLTNEKGDILEFTYGTDQQRIKTVLTQEGKETVTTYYIGGIYEYEETPSYTKRRNYVKGDRYVVIWENDNRYHNPNYAEIFYIFTDHLGSYEHMVNYGIEVQSQSFDIWGNRRNPKNWQEPNTDTEYIFTRGFSGHEHLEAFNLINMNGRVYDPVLGQFLSPDPLAEQSPGNSPYSYCGFDPVNFIDPSGLKEVYSWTPPSVPLSDIYYNGWDLQGKVLVYFNNGNSMRPRFMYPEIFSAGDGRFWNFGWIGFGGEIEVTNPYNGNPLGGGTGSSGGGGSLGADDVKEKLSGVKRVSMDDKLKAYIAYYEPELRKALGNEVFESTEFKHSWLVGIRESFAETSERNIPSGKLYEGYEGNLSTITFSRSIINKFWRNNEDLKAKETIFHEFFHVDDFYKGYDSYIENNLEDDDIRNFLEFTAMKRVYDLIGIKNVDYQKYEIQYNLILPKLKPVK